MRFYIVEYPIYDFCDFFCYDYYMGALAQKGIQLQVIRNKKGSILLKSKYQWLMVSVDQL